jgi:putative redox protein
MVTTTTIYEGDLHCQLTHDPSGAAFATDAPKDNRGKGESFSPTDLVGAALGSCLLTIMGMAARDSGVTIDGATAKISKIMTASPVRRVARLDVTIAIPHAPPLADRERLEAAALACPVKQSLHPDIDMPISFHWGAEPA